MLCRFGTSTSEHPNVIHAAAPVVNRLPNHNLGMGGASSSKAETVKWNAFKNDPTSQILQTAAEQGDIDAIKDVLDPMLPGKPTESTERLEMLIKLILAPAVQGGHKELVKYLLQNGGKKSIDFHSPNDKTPLLLAASFAHTEILQLLLENGANPNYRHRGFNKMTPLYWACMTCDLEMVQLLLSHKADPNLGANYAPIDYVVQSHVNEANQVPICEALLLHGAKTTLIAEPSLQWLKDKKLV